MRVGVVYVGEGSRDENSGGEKVCVRPGSIPRGRWGLIRISTRKEVPVRIHKTQPKDSHPGAIA